MTKKLTKKADTKVSFIRKANDLVEGKYKFDIWEMRIFTKMVTLIAPEDRDFKEYKIYLKDIIAFFGLKRDGRNYQHLKESAMHLMNRIVTVIVRDNDGLMELHTPIVGAIKNPLHNEDDDENVYIKLSFHPDLKPFLLALRTKYIVYDAQNIMRLPSTYSIRIYELLKQYEKIGQRRISVQELKEMFGVTSEYKMYANFKQRIIDKAQKDLAEHTDICFTYDEIKQGRAVVELIFYIANNERTKGKTSNEPYAQNDSVSMVAEQLAFFTADVTAENSFERLDKEAFFELIFTEVAPWGISSEVLELLIETQERVALINGMDYTKRAIKAGKVDENKLGYFITAVKDNLTEVKIAQEKKKNQRISKEKIEEEKQRQLQADYDKLAEKYEAERNNIIRELTQNDLEVTEQAMQELRQDKSIISYAKVKNIDLEVFSVEDFRKEPILRAAVLREIQRQHPAAFITLNAYQEMMEQIAQQLATNNG